MRKLIRKKVKLRNIFLWSHIKIVLRPSDLIKSDISQLHYLTDIQQKSDSILFDCTPSWPSHSLPKFHRIQLTEVQPSPFDRIESEPVCSKTLWRPPTQVKSCYLFEQSIGSSLENQASESPWIVCHRHCPGHSNLIIRWTYFTSQNLKYHSN